MDVEWGDLDILILDLPSRSQSTVNFNPKNKMTGAIIVTTPQDIALSDVPKRCHYV